MVCHDSIKRYQSTIATLQALKRLSNFTMLQLDQEFITPSAEEETAAETRIWAEGFGAEELPPTEPPPS